jgi:hypothetical protein
LLLIGHHTLDEAKECVPVARALFEKLGKCEFVPDLRQLTGFDTAARVMWQEELAHFRKSIHTLTMIGGSPLTRMTGAAVCLFAGIKMRFVDTLEEAMTPTSTKRAT